MNRLSKNKRRIMFIVLILVSIISIRIYLFNLHNKLPKFHIKAPNGELINSDTFSGYPTCIVMIKKVNSVSYDTIKKIESNMENPIKVLIIFDGKEKLIIDIKNTNTRFLEVTSWNYINKLFFLSGESDNLVFFYDNSGYLENVYSLKAKNIDKIISKFSGSNAFEIKGNVNKINEKIVKFMSYKKNGYYYFTTRLLSSCACMQIYEDLENYSYEIGEKLKLVLLGDWNEKDENNILFERNYRIEIFRGVEEINRTVSNWQTETQRRDFNLMGVKKNDKTELFTILDDKDYDILNDYLEKNIKTRMSNKRSN